MSLSHRKNSQEKKVQTLEQDVTTWKERAEKAEKAERQKSVAILQRGSMMPSMNISNSENTKVFSRSHLTTDECRIHLSLLSLVLVCVCVRVCVCVCLHVWVAV